MDDGGGMFVQNAFYSAVRKQIEPQVAPLGFRHDRQYYYRIVQAVVQQFCPLWLYHDFTIRFTLRSLYQDNMRRAEGLDVMRIVDGTNRWLGSAITEIAPNVYLANEDFCTATEKTLRSCADTCEKMLTEHLLPWFQTNTDSASAYAACENAGLFLLPEGAVLLIAGLGFLLGMGDWERARETLRPYVEHSVNCNLRWWARMEPEYLPLYQALTRCDFQYIQNYMQEKRRKNIAEFRWKVL